MAFDSLSLQRLITRGKVPFSRALQSSRTSRSISTGVKVPLAATLNWNAQFNWQGGKISQSVPARTRADPPRLLQRLVPGPIFKWVVENRMRISIGQEILA